MYILITSKANKLVQNIIKFKITQTALILQVSTVDVFIVFEVTSNFMFNYKL